MCSRPAANASTGWSGTILNSTYDLFSEHSEDFTSVLLKSTTCSDGEMTVAQQSFDESQLSTDMIMLSLKDLRFKIVC